MTRTTVRGGLWLLVAMAAGCVGNSQKSHRPDAGGWITVLPAHDAGASDRTGADARSSLDATPRDAVADAKPATAHDAAADAKTAADARADAKAAQDARPDAVLLGGNGQSCSSRLECLSGFCVDGVCCNAACTGACVSCATIAKVGTCSTIAAGFADLHGMCSDQGVASCGRTGTCNGAGGCALYPRGSACARPFCTGQVWTPSGTCDGTGACVTPASLNCSPYACVNATCQASCASPADCASGQTCVAGTCGNGRIAGSTCGGNGDCNSGFCSQGVCCASGCDGVCSSCALQGTIGTCTPLPATQQPDGSVCP